MRLQHSLICSTFAQQSVIILIVARTAWIITSQVKDMLHQIAIYNQCYNRFSSPVGTENRGGLEVGEILTTAHQEFGGVTTMTVPTPIRPIPTCLHPSRVTWITPEHPMPNPNPLTPSCLSNALSNTPTPLRLVDAFPTQCSFDLSSPSRQVDSWHPPSFLTQRLSTFTLLCQVYSWHLIGLATAVGRSPIAYLPCSMCHSLSFLALYIYVPLRSSVTSLLWPGVT